MTYFPDLSPYMGSSRSIPTRNVGWLDPSHAFPMAVPTQGLLERLWPFCLVSVQLTRGLERCPLCEQFAVGERKGTRIVAGTAEIRVFDRTGQAAFAAPDFIYHFIEVHQYSPPPEFLEALESGPQPASHEYRELLRKSGAKWTATKVNDGVFRFVRRPDGEVVKEWIVEPKPKA